MRGLRQGMRNEFYGNLGRGIICTATSTIPSSLSRSPFSKSLLKGACSHGEGSKEKKEREEKNRRRGEGREEIRSSYDFLQFFALVLAFCSRGRTCTVQTRNLDSTLSHFLLFLLTVFLYPDTPARNVKREGMNEK